MVSLYRARSERQSSKTQCIKPGITEPYKVPKNKSHGHVSKENTAPKAVPKTLDFPSSVTPLRHLFKTPVTVLVGPTNHPISLHLEALCSISPFFAAAFNPTYSFRESITSTLILPTHSVADFEYFVQWLYARTLTHESLDGPHPAYFRLIRLWKVADWLGATRLKNAVIDEMGRRSEGTNSVVTPDDTKSIWEAEEEVGMLKLLVLDLFVGKKTDHLLETHPDSWDEGFLRELCGRLKRAGGKREMFWKDDRQRCGRYHVHDEWAPRTSGCVEDDGAPYDG